MKALNIITPENLTPRTPRTPRSLQTTPNSTSPREHTMSASVHVDDPAVYPQTVSFAELDPFLAPRMVTTSARGPGSTAADDDTVEAVTTQGVTATITKESSL